ncbi:hypothetical protein BDV96DRAFT_122263 [Lophiotrema nucula]|uniref:Uncharacterized protein n=1 Tax=Lophiotrema nucula TaxID=690887 RepID=A0A6A5Z1T2_9PLEO|nr:hypothetical protein BDV96DRAFT_122263 [Lophiotrema nucula]
MHGLLAFDLAVTPCHSSRMHTWRASVRNSMRAQLAYLTVNPVFPGEMRLCSMTSCIQRQPLSSDILQSHIVLLDAVQKDLPQSLQRHTSPFHTSCAGQDPHNTCFSLRSTSSRFPSRSAAIGRPFSPVSVRPSPYMYAWIRVMIEDANGWSAIGATEARDWRSASLVDGWLWVACAGRDDSNCIGAVSFNMDLEDGWVRATGGEGWLEDSR